MKFDWLHYLTLAQDFLDEVNTSLNQGGNSSSHTSNASLNEAKLRCAISRAYYSVFCLARNYLRDIKGDIELKKPKEYDLRSHKYVMEKFRESKERDYKDIGINLERMRETRNQADCNDYMPLNTLLANTKVSIKSAKYAIDLLKKLEANQ